MSPSLWVGLGGVNCNVSSLVNSLLSGVLLAFFLSAVASLYVPAEAARTGLARAALPRLQQEYDAAALALQPSLSGAGGGREWGGSSSSRSSLLFVEEWRMLACCGVWPIFFSQCALGGVVPRFKHKSTWFPTFSLHAHIYKVMWTPL